MLKRFAGIVVEAVILAGTFALIAAPASSQMNTAEITGEVKDPTNAVIAGATVVGTHVATQQKFSAVTNDSGLFLLPQLPLGEYTLTVSAPGFKQAVQDHVVLHVGDHVRQDFELALGEQSETVTVEGSAGLLQVQSAEIKDVIQNQQVVDLPLKGREFLELTLLSEGVVSPPGGTRGDALQQTGKLINVMGNRTGHNLFLVDGVNVTDEYFNNVVLNPSTDAIAEFNMLKTNYNAEFGGKSGAVVNVITKSGGNAFHGSAYEFLRNNIFDARNFFTPPSVTPPFRENQFGATLGGPMIRDKTFFFLNYEGQRTRNSLPQKFSVPTSVERTGDLTALSSTSFSQFRDPFTGTVYAGTNLNTDPNFYINPAAQALLNQLLPPTSSGNSNNLLDVGQESMDTNQYNARIDHQFSMTDSAFIRASVFDANEFDPFGSSTLNEALLPGFGRTLRTHSVNFSVGETHTFNANLLNEFRFGWLSVSGGQGDPNAGNPFASQYGLLGTTENPADTGYPQVNLSGVFSTIGTAAGFTTRVDRNYEFFDNVLWHHGNHTVQFGGYFFHLDFNPSFPNNARGTYTFSGSQSGNAFADFLFGVPSQGQVGIGEGAENAHTNWAHFYIQDGWQITPSLKLDVGVRYEYNSNLVADSNQTSNIDLTAPGGPSFVLSGNPANLTPAQNALVAIAAAQSPAIPVVTAASVGWNDSLLRPRPLRFSPRLGLAWTIPKSGETVVRAGYGIYTNQAAYSVLQNFAENIPFFLNKTVNNNTATCGSTPCTINNILSFSPNGAIGANSVNHNFAIEYNEVWNLSVQRPVSRTTSVELEYVGSRTVHADSSTAVNLPQPGAGGVQSRRPYPNLNAFTTIRWDGWAFFNSLTIKATRRFTKGLSFDGSYSWSHSIDDASDAGTTNAELNLPQDIYANNLAVEKANSSFDHRHRVTANVVYDLPFANNSDGWLHRTVGGWRASGNLIVQSGAPFTVNLSTGNEVSNIGLVNGNNLERPNVSADPNQGPKTPQQWFNTAAFSLPAALTFGNAPRNNIIGPGLVDIDSSLQKEFALNESAKLQFRFDAFNLFNHPNFNLPGRIFGASNFGVIQNAQDPRELQFALKFLF
ncbi:MAG TPA: carboxypeptidase regulatory-like domain-containing protein [Candidatus Acidoferrales bacterium]|nr:carboxypeptidase regulatory-like domain-containing protein [Candidatus Acidoferrales bacterium]